jgi:D-sedoheptulose 7-phosphate isomerase
MSLTKRIKAVFVDGISLKKTVGETLVPTIVEAGQLLAGCLRDGGKILSCGNGGSACDANHFNTEMVNRFMIERSPLPAISLNTDMAVLTAIANDYDYADVFAKQIKALGKKGDVLLAISTSGNSLNIVRAINMAHESGMPVVALTGRDGGDIAGALIAGDIEIRVPGKVTPRIQEVHITIIHCLCDLIDHILFEKN